MTLGRTGLEVSRIGLGASYGVGRADVERAFDRGINFLYWGAVRRPGFGAAIRNIAKTRRHELVVAVQTYSRASFAMAPSVEIALRRLRIDYADVLILGWWNRRPPERILDAALTLREAGKVRYLMISSHNRRVFEAFSDDPCYGAIMVRYSAAHPGAEREVFPLLADRPARPGVVAFTATRWGQLVDSDRIPTGEPVPRASDCYRFVLTHPQVDVCLAGPKNGTELDEALRAIDRGPLDNDELEWMRRVGSAVHRAGTAAASRGPRRILSRLAKVIAPGDL